MLPMSLDKIMEYFEPRTITHQLAVRVKDLEARLAAAKEVALEHAKEATRLATVVEAHQNMCAILGEAFGNWVPVSPEGKWIKDVFDQLTGEFEPAKERDLGQEYSRGLADAKAVYQGKLEAATALMADITIEKAKTDAKIEKWEALLDAIVYKCCDYDVELSIADSMEDGPHLYNKGKQKAGAEIEKMIKAAGYECKERPEGV